MLLELVLVVEHQRPVTHQDDVEVQVDHRDASTRTTSGTVVMST